ncbi:hypothetical protein QR680_016654 [Steinernema hermaphroditum]|uniref:Tyrosine-protein phosphatase domain-containing protein n=1 Tax=Steinernema hermaphroditum TaxID=289476 RepID=A0AA39HBW7_9BILA|nr:hypothetical protein QR680_016654 [Steinernema hermaphroditum]
MGNRANKAPRPQERALRPHLSKFELQPAATPSTPEMIDTESRPRVPKRSVERVRKANEPRVERKPDSSRRAKNQESKKDRLAESSVVITQSQKDGSLTGSKRSINSKRANGSKAKSTNDDTNKIVGSMPQAAGNDDVVKELITRFCNATLQKGVRKLREEFARLKSETVPSPDSLASFHANPTRNRYRDIPCVEESRVKLIDHPDQMDYIHANYVSTPFNERRFICTQGPMETTIYDFWWMVLQEKAEFIVMLCNMDENGRPKCDEYLPFLPSSGSMVFRDISISVQSVNIIKPDNSASTEMISERVLRVTRNRLERTIKHFHWSSWPDHGVPTGDLAPLVLLQRIRQTKFPIIIHCSAGIGRTGSIVAIEYVLERIIYKQPCDDMAVILKSLRKQRAHSIQTDLQYLYVHFILLRYYTELKYIDQNNLYLVGFCREYEQAIPTNPHGKLVQALYASSLQPQPTPPNDEADDANPTRW